MIDYDKILCPAMREHIRGYIEEGAAMPPVLNSMFCNDLFQVIHGITVGDIGFLYNTVDWIYRNAPAACVGNAAVVKAWRAHDGRQGLTSTRKVKWTITTVDIPGPEPKG